MTADDYPFGQLDPDTICMLARVFNDAVEQLHVADLDARLQTQIKAIAAARLMAAVAQGERDPNRLLEAAMLCDHTLN